MIIWKWACEKTLVLALALLCVGQAWADSVNLAMGNPSQATSNRTNKDNFLLDRDFYALSYNDSKGTPNWVSWRLGKENIGKIKRKDRFAPDSDLPGGFVHVTPTDYAGMGFDKGHMCPYADRSSDTNMGIATFKMSNMLPQSSPLNTKAWERLESYCRDLAKKNKTLYIISGPNGVGGEGKNGLMNEIGKRNKVTVPKSCWKVIMVLDGDDLQKVNKNTRLIAVVMPNDMSAGEEWAGFRVSVKAVEQMTGYKFFSRIPEAIIEPLKAKLDDEPIRGRK